MDPIKPAPNALIETDASGYVEYFAYGSNLSIRQMKQRIGTAPAARLAVLNDHQLVFNSRAGDEYFANVRPAPGKRVWGVIYRCQLRAMLLLDRYEGVAQGCYRRLRTVVEANNLCQPVEIYLAPDASLLPAGPPSAVYLERIISGAKEHLLPTEYIREVERLGGHTG